MEKTEEIHGLKNFEAKIWNLRLGIWGYEFAVRLS